MKHLFAVAAISLVCARSSGGAPLAKPATLNCGTDDLAQPVIDKRPDWGRLRSHTEGQLSKSWLHTWTGPAIPQHVPQNVGELELFILDSADGGHFAFYREPYGRTSCELSSAKNCAYEARFYDANTDLAWSVRLDKFFSAKEHLEVQDIRLASGVLYFNEACQSYSKEAGGKCSRLVAIDPAAKRVLWKTAPLVSNGRFRIRGCYIVAAYGFTAEPDHVFVVKRSTGKLVQTLAVSSAPQGMKLVASDRLDAVLHSGATRNYRLDGFDTAKPTLVDLGPPEQFGGATYGGQTYGGRP